MQQRQPRRKIAGLSLAPPESEDAQEEAATDNLHTQGESEDGWHDDAQDVLGVQGSETLFGPAGDGEDRSADSEHNEQAAGGQAFLQSDKAEGAVEARVLGQQALGDGEDLGEDGEGAELKSHEHRNEGIQERMHVESDAVDEARPRQ